MRDSAVAVGERFREPDVDWDSGGEGRRRRRDISRAVTSYVTRAAHLRVAYLIYTHPNWLPCRRRHATKLEQSSRRFHSAKRRRSLGAAPIVRLPVVTSVVAERRDPSTLRRSRATSSGVQLFGSVGVSDRAVGRAHSAVSRSPVNSALSGGRAASRLSQSIGNRSRRAHESRLRRDPASRFAHAGWSGVNPDRVTAGSARASFEQRLHDVKEDMALVKTQRGRDTGVPSRATAFASAASASTSLSEPRIRVTRAGGLENIECRSANRSAAATVGLAVYERAGRPRPHSQILRGPSDGIGISII